MQTFFGIVAVLSGLGLVVVYAHELGRKRGFKDGWKSAEEWVIEAEAEVEKARQKIWREEG